MERVANTFYIQCLIVAMAINFSATGQAAEMKLSQEQQGIWGLVESFLESAHDGDLEGLMNLLHPKLSGFQFWTENHHGKC